MIKTVYFWKKKNGLWDMTAELETNIKKKVYAGILLNDFEELSKLKKEISFLEDVGFEEKIEKDSEKTGKFFAHYYKHDLFPDDHRSIGLALIARGYADISVHYYKHDLSLDDWPIGLALIARGFVDISVHYK